MLQYVNPSINGDGDDGGGGGDGGGSLHLEPMLLIEPVIVITMIVYNANVISERWRTSAIISQLTCTCSQSICILSRHDVSVRYLLPFLPITIAILLEIAAQRTEWRQWW